MEGNIFEQGMYIVFSAMYEAFQMAVVLFDTINAWSMILALNFSALAVILIILPLRGGGHLGSDSVKSKKRNSQDVEKQAQRSLGDGG